MSAETPSSAAAGDMETVVLKDDEGRQLVCYVEEPVQLEGNTYALLTPVDTPVCLVRLAEDESDHEIIEDLEGAEEILSIADAVLQEHDLTLVRSAHILTVNGEIDGPELEEEDEDEAEAGDDLDELDDLDEDGESDTYEMLLDRPFWVGEEQYALFIPLDPLFLVARLDQGGAELVSDEELERVGPLIEAAIEEQPDDD
ncbi:MAG: DUF3727 domain-containing protein [Synechococcaceae cyanobacterium]